MSQSQLNEYLKEKWKEMKLMGISQICIISSNLTPEIQILISYTCNILCNTWVSNRNLIYNIYKTELLIPPSRMCNSYSVSHHTTGDHHSRSCSYQKPWQHTWLVSFSPVSYTDHQQIQSTLCHCSLCCIQTLFNNPKTSTLFPVTIVSDLDYNTSLSTGSPFPTLVSPSSTQHVLFKT